MKLKASFWLVLAAAVCVIGGALALSGCGRGKIEVSNERVASTLKTDSPWVKVFIENSGSMDGYMNGGSQLKDAVYDFVSDLNQFSAGTSLYYINSTVIPYRGDLTSYIRDLNPASFRQAGGNRASTDLGSIFSNVISEVNDTTVVVFVSDCILDLPSKDAPKYLSNCEIRIKNEVGQLRNRLPDLGVEVLKLSSDFSGNYYESDGAVVKLTEVKRPYYMWIFGDKNYLAKLNGEVPLSLLGKHGLGNSVAFTGYSEIPYEVKNKSLTGQMIKPTKGDYHLTALLDLRSTLQTEEAATDARNYTFNNPRIKVEGVYPIKDRKSPYTHYVSFVIPKGVNVAQERLTFNNPEIPVWVEQSNDETGKNIESNIDKTTGIKYLVGGVADAYRNDRVGAEMKFNVKRK